MTRKKFLTATICPLGFAVFVAFSALASEAVKETTVKGFEQRGEASFLIQDYGSGQTITEEEGIALAFAHAGFARDEVKRERSEYDRDDGMNILEVEFEVDDDEYEYEIDLDDGRILSASYDMSDRKQRELPVQDTAISDSEAAALILEKVPEAATDDMWIEAERDDGILYYEIEFILNGVKYDFDVDADAGAITSWDQELMAKR